MFRLNLRETAAAVRIECRFVLFVLLLIGGGAQSKIFDKCALARRLLHRHHLAWDQVQTWVCIASLQSNLNTATVNYDADGIGYHGMYQISDRYWCGPGNVCNLNCDRLLDDDLSDDLACIAHIFAEHQRISGNGYTAWTVYERNCAPGRVPSMDECFEDSVGSSNAVSVAPKVVDIQDKVYDRCELARELKFVHGMPGDQIATWVCIAKHESNFHTSVVGRLNADGSSDHGLFQISNIYWCSPNGWACGVTCAQMRDSNITDDVQCIKMIHAEHQRLSGDGFNAWAVYQPYCRHRSAEYIEGCFKQGELDTHQQPHTISVQPIHKTSAKGKGKVYSRCELAVELRDRHHIPEEQISTWVCIAHHESRYNTSAVGRLNADGSGDHGLFQISDIYWCSPPGKGWVCGLSCDDLEDNDLTDDVKCMRTIYDEHQRISGDGFTAWAVYQPYCHGRTQSYLDGCYESVAGGVNSVESGIPFKSISSHHNVSHKKPPATGKVYGRCELARELRFQHGIPLDQIATWVCIAKHESLYNTAAVGRLNADGSADHGLFQISDVYWCSPPGKGWACGVSCSDLEDSDITDDVKCIQTIHAEHTRISGDGFRAWAVYEPYCLGRSSQYADGCFDEAITVQSDNEIGHTETELSAAVKMSTGKVFERCELALELHNKHRIPIEQISTWVCIAEHESHFNTSAVGRLNGDGSADHGIFQISDIYWCSPPGQGWVCGLSCADLEDDDISDDVRCLRKIFDEHQRLSGDGFNAWAVYPIHCKGRSINYTEDCFKDLTKAKPESPPSWSKATYTTTSIKPSTATTATSNTKFNKFTLSGETNRQHKTTTAPSWNYIKPNNVLTQSALLPSKPPTTEVQPTTTTQRPTTTTHRPTTTTHRPTNTTNRSTPSTHRNATKATTTKRPNATSWPINTNRPTTNHRYSSSSTPTPTKKTTPKTTHASEIKTTKINTTTENTFALYLNGFSTKKPTTFYSFSTAKTPIPTTTPTEWNYHDNSNDGKWNSFPQKMTATKSSTAKWNAFTKLTTKHSPDSIGSTQKPPTTTTSSRYLSHHKSPSTTSTINTQRPWSTKSSSSTTTTTTASNLHSISTVHQIPTNTKSKTIKPSSSETPPQTTLPPPLAWNMKSSATRPTTKPSTPPFTLESHHHHSRKPTPTTVTQSTPTTTGRPSVDASVQTILDIQATTKSAFDKLFDLFQH